MVTLDLSLTSLLAVAVLGAISSVFILKLISPILISSFQDSRELKDPAILKIIQERLDHAGLPLLRVDRWSEGPRKSANAMVVGLIGVPRFFRARILLSESVINDFNRNELDAILAHEISHFRLNHLSKRVWTPFIIYLSIIFSGVMGLAPFVSSTRLAVFLTIVIVAIAYILSFSILLRHLVRSQELDADWMAVHHFGINLDLYLNTLDKMSKYNDRATKVDSQSSHPTNSERKENLLREVGLKSPPHEKRFIKQVGTSTATAMILIFLSSVLISSLRPTPSRQPAAAQKSR